MARVIVPYIIRQFYDTKTTGSAGIRAADLIIYPLEIAASRAVLCASTFPGLTPWALLFRPFRACTTHASLREAS